MPGPAGRATTSKRGGAGGTGRAVRHAWAARAYTIKVIARFRADRDEEYRKFLGKCDDFEAEIAKETTAQYFTYAELEENDEDLKKLKTWIAQITKLDFYGGNLKDEANARLANCEALLDLYAKQVFEAQDENR